MKEVYRRRRLAALAVLAVLFLAVLALFGALGTQATSQVQGDQLGPDGESRAEYIAVSYTHLTLPTILLV